MCDEKRVFKAIEVNEDDRLDFLDKQLAYQYVNFHEYVCKFAQLYAKNYKDIIWNFYEINQPHENTLKMFFMCPNRNKTYRCVSHNGIEDNFDAKTFGVIITIVTLSHLHSISTSPLIAYQYKCLRDYAFNYHEQREAIARFID